MFTLYDRSRHSIGLDQQVARGGQGAIFSVNGQPGLLAKVYIPKPDEELEDKLTWMVDHAPPDPSAPQHATFAWPADLLYDAQRHFLGYVMPRVRDAWPILRVFNPRSREQTLPGFGRRYLYRAALNLARALEELHRRDYVVGDLNESNVLVTRQALVALIDNDSFQVQEPRNHRIIVYPCPVGKPEYTAPELQGEVLWTRPRRWEQDAFALGVMVFQLLMEGNHPFRARWLAAGDPPPLAERIQAGLYPYDPAAPASIAPPPGVPGLDSLAPEVVDLFRRCFVEGHGQPSRRPAAEEWAAALARTEYTAGLRGAGTAAPSGASTATQRAAGAPSGQRAGTGAGQRGRPATGGGAPRPNATGAGASPRRGRAPTGPAGSTASPLGAAARQGLARVLQNWAQTRPPAAQSGDQLMRLLAQLTAAFLGGGAAGAAGPTSGAAAAQAGPTSGGATGARGAASAAARPAAATGPQTRAAPAGAASRLIECPRCGRGNNPDEIYCQRCSYPLAGEKPCPRCGKPMPKNTRYCTHCSSRV